MTPILTTLAPGLLEAGSRLITHDPKQSAFAAGWMNRMAEFVEGTV